MARSLRTYPREVVRLVFVQPDVSPVSPPEMAPYDGYTIFWLDEVGELERIGLRSIPTLIVLRPDGSVSAAIEGFDSNWALADG